MRKFAWMARHESGKDMVAFHNNRAISTVQWRNSYGEQRILRKKLCHSRRLVQGQILPTRLLMFVVRGTFGDRPGGMCVYEIVTYHPVWRTMGAGLPGDVRIARHVT